MTVAAIESGVAVLVEAREIILEFQGIIRRKALAELDTWISRARSQPCRRLRKRRVQGQSSDRGGGRAVVVQRANRRQICKLKLVKRQMYGRGNIDLLQARVIGLS